MMNARHMRRRESVRVYVCLLGRETKKALRSLGFRDFQQLKLNIRMQMFRFWFLVIVGSLIQDEQFLFAVLLFEIDERRVIHHVVADVLMLDLRGVNFESFQCCVGLCLRPCHAD